MLPKINIALPFYRQTNERQYFSDVTQVKVQVVLQY